MSKESNSDEAEATKGTPKWAMQPFEDFVRDVERLSQLVDLSVRGISMLRAAPKMLRAVAKAEDNLCDEMISFSSRNLNTVWSVRRK